MQTIDMRRELIDKSLQEFKRWVSVKTKLVHFSYEDKSHSDYVCPLYENFCYLLALFESKQKENILHAKELLEKLLAFQNFMDEESIGGFPIYLHEYPKCKNTYLHVHILYPLYYILKRYENVLEQHLIDKLTNAIDALYDRALKTHESFPYKDAMLLKLKAFTSAYKSMEQMSLEDFAIDTNSSKTIAETLVALQMASPSKEVIKEVLSKASAFWSVEYQTYIGPAIKEYQERFDLALTMLDLFMALSLQTDLYKLKQPSSLLMHAPLIFPFDIDQVDDSISSHDPNWDIMSKDGLHLSSRKEFLPSDDPLGPSHHLFRALWKEEKSLHSLVCQEKSLAMSFLNQQDTSFLFTYSPELPGEGKKEYELALFTNIEKDKEILVNNEKSTVFNLGDTISIVTKTKTLNLCFEIVEGEGRILGHLFYGNRPSQLIEDIFQAFDWKISLRTLNRSENLKVKLKFHWS